jgi:sugar lactone lactonase YvrE
MRPSPRPVSLPSPPASTALLATACAAAACTAAGCGSVPLAELPPPAGPAAAPPLGERPAGRVVRVGERPLEVVVAGGGRVAVRLRGPSGIAVVDGRSGRLVRRHRPSAAPRRLAGGLGAPPVRRRLRPAPREPLGVAVTADGRLAVVIAGRERTIAVHDARTGRRLGHAPAGVGPTNVVTRGNDAYVTDTRGGSLLVFSLRPRLELVRRASLRGGPYGIALDAVRNRLWVTLTARNVLAELPATRLPRIVRHVPAVRQPNGVAVDPRSGRVYVTGAHAGVLQIVDP